MRKDENENTEMLLSDDYSSVKRKLERIYDRKEPITDLEYVGGLLKKQGALNKRIDELINVSKAFRGKVHLKEGRIYEVNLF